MALQLHDSIFPLPDFITGWGPGAYNTALVWTRILGDQEKATVTPIRVRERKERPPRLVPRSGELRAMTLTHNQLKAFSTEETQTLEKPQN